MALARVPGWVIVVLIVACFGVLGWHGATALGPLGGFDARGFVDYAEVLDRTDRLPTSEETYEYAIPPGFPLVAQYAQSVLSGLAPSPGSIVPGSPNPYRRPLWLALVVSGTLLSGLVRRRWAIACGCVLGAVAAAWALADIVTLGASVRWSSGMLVSLAFGCGALVVTWLLAQEVWPRSRHAPGLVVLATAASPVMLRLAVMFHPEMQYSFFVLLAVLLLVRACRRGWPIASGLMLGAALGAAALTRQSAPAPIVALLGATLLAGRRRALAFSAVTLVAVSMVAGPWWIYQANRFGNPIEANLEREGYMLEDGQPVSFFVSLPVRDLAGHPYREAMRNELLPKFHAELWSDWFGRFHDNWVDPTRAERFFASSQSLLGFGADALAIGGLVGFGLPAIRRYLRGLPERPADFPAATGLILAAVTWSAFVVTLIRFPQADGDPIKSSYMLFLAPVFAAAAVASARLLWSRAWGWRVALLVWSAFYAASYAGFLATSF